MTFCQIVATSFLAIATIRHQRYTGYTQSCKDIKLGETPESIELKVCHVAYIQPFISKRNNMAFGILNVI